MRALAAMITLVNIMNVVEVGALVVAVVSL